MFLYSAISGNGVLDMSSDHMKTTYYFCTPFEKQSFSMVFYLPIREYSSVFQAEITAVMEYACENLKRGFQDMKISIFIDSQAGLKVIISHSVTYQGDMHGSYSTLGKRTRNIVNGQTYKRVEEGNLMDVQERHSTNCKCRDSGIQGQFDRPILLWDMTVGVGRVCSLTSEVLASLNNGVPPPAYFDWRGWFRAGLPFFLEDITLRFSALILPHGSRYEAAPSP
ncbi:hypothetical protein J6590_092629 [Homalodisca vitripennis]|nr:hypothetical protein J6590_092629 [Homalodisca vitripennis]